MICHNTAWAIAENFDSETIVADFDLAFGTLGLDFNQDSARGIGDALTASARLDAAMVEEGIIEPHPRFTGSESSGYRLIERAYKEILGKLPAELKPAIPVWDQIPMERFIQGYVDGLDMDTWHQLLNLTPVESEE